MEIHKNPAYKDLWLWCTVVGAMIFLVTFFYPVLQYSGQIFFNTGGDGFQTYYTALFHIKFDSAYSTQQAMNYPFRESIFFTGCEPLFSIPLKLLHPYFHLDHTLITLTNIIPLVSIIFCAVFVYLILKAMDIPGLWSCLFAIGISYMSPQIFRLQGHYSLTYQFALPFFIYQFIRFNKKANISISIQTGIVLFVLGSIHLYFVAFFLFIFTGYWISQLVLKNLNPHKNKSDLRFIFTHTLLQALIPVAVLMIIMHLLNTADDRTAMPWGMIAYKSSLSGMFYPYGRPYEFLVKSFVTPELTEWEGIAYTGIFGTITTLAILTSKIKNLILHIKTPSNYLSITGNILLDTFLWTGVVAAIYGCGSLLFVKTEKVIDFLGPLKQLRGIGRFTWLFYYIINMAGVYFFYHLLQQQKKYVKIFVMVLLVFILYADAIANVMLINKTLNNRIPSMDDTSNRLPENKWLNNITPSHFQAILPIPFFQVGAENFGTGMQHHQVVLTTQLISLKTGLPMVSMTSSRSSLKESWLNFQFSLENYRPKTVIQNYPNKKPLLVLAWPDKIPPAQQNLFSKCKWLSTSAAGYSIYELAYDSLIFDGMLEYQQHLNQLQKTPVYSYPTTSGLLVSDSLADVTYLPFDNESEKESGYFSKGCKKIRSKEYELLLSKKNNSTIEQHFHCSFWVKNISADLKGRIFILFISKNAKGEIVQYTNFYAPGNIVAADAEWGLIELPLILKPDEINLEVYVHNDDLPSKSYYCIDEFLLKPENCNVFKQNPDFLMHNNRYFPKQFPYIKTVEHHF